MQLLAAIIAAYHSTTRAWPRVCSLTCLRWPSVAPPRKESIVATSTAVSCTLHPHDYHLKHLIYIAYSWTYLVA